MTLQEKVHIRGWREFLPILPAIQGDQWVVFAGGLCRKRKCKNKNKIRTKRQIVRAE